MPARTETSGPELTEAMALFCGLIFVNDPVDKIYVEIADYVGHDARALHRYFVEEAVFKDIVYRDGRTWDVRHWSLLRSTFEEHVAAAAQASHTGPLTLEQLADRVRPYLNSDDELDRTDLDSLALIEAAVAVEQLTGTLAEEVLDRLGLGERLHLDELHERHIASAVERQLTGVMP